MVAPFLAGLVVLVASLLSRPARADDELGALLIEAREQNLDLAESSALADEAAAQRQLERAAMLPRLSVSGGYTFNQHESVVDLPSMAGASESFTLVPRNQLELSFTLQLPVIDVAAWRRVDAAEAEVRAARVATEAMAEDVERAVVVAWYQWVAGTALIEAARVAEATARDTVSVVEGRKGAGSVSDADVARARADVATAQQDLAAAELAVAIARRQLVTLAGRAPEGPAPALAEATAAEAPLETWLDEIDGLASVRAVVASRDAAEARVDVANGARWPTIGVFASERVTNASGFGEVASFTAGVTLTWRLDLTTRRTADRARASVRTGAVRVARAAQQARDRVVDAWNTVEARRATAVAALARVDAARAALDVTRTRVVAGLAAPIDLSTSQRDAFAAEVSLLGARAELAAARALLRIAAGQEAAP